MPPKRGTVKAFEWANCQGQLSEFGKGAIFALFELGLSLRHVGQLVAVHHTTVDNVAKGVRQLMTDPSMGGIIIDKRKRPRGSPSVLALRTRLEELWSETKPSGDYCFRTCADIRKALAEECLFGLLPATASYLDFGRTVAPLLLRR